MSEHLWVTMQYTPIEVTPQEDGSLKIEATEAAIEAALEGSVYVCWFCEIDLTPESHRTECTAPHPE